MTTIQTAIWICFPVTVTVKTQAAVSLQHRKNFSTFLQV